MMNGRQFAGKLNVCLRSEAVWAFDGNASFFVVEHEGCDRTQVVELNPSDHLVECMVDIVVELQKYLSKNKLWRILFPGDDDQGTDAFIVYPDAVRGVNLDRFTSVEEAIRSNIERRYNRQANRRRHQDQRIKEVGDAIRLSFDDLQKDDRPMDIVGSYDTLSSYGVDWAREGTSGISVNVLLGRKFSRPFPQIRSEFRFTVYRAALDGALSSVTGSKLRGNELWLVVFDCPDKTVDRISFRIRSEQYAIVRKLKRVEVVQE